MSVPDYLQVPATPAGGSVSPSDQNRDADLDPRLVVVSRSPLNAELPLAFQKGVTTPTPLFFHRNRFDRPQVSIDEWQVEVDGDVDRPFVLRYDDLIAMPSRTLMVTLECAGNGRTAFSPAVEGEPWQYGAVSTAEWTGVPLALILQEAGIRPRTREILAVGADSGSIAGWGTARFERSLPLEKALHPDTLIAYLMNGETLTPAHGYPARLIVPGWYGMASVKWLSRISALQEPFSGYFQSERYVLFPGDDTQPQAVTSVAPRSLIISPGPGEQLSAARVRITGLAWSGLAPIELVEVSIDGGAWSSAHWTSGFEPYAWRTWEFWWEPASGAHELQSRATDAAGNRQNPSVPWNRYGYMNNAIQCVPVFVTQGATL